MIIGGIRVSLRGPWVLEGGQFLCWSRVGVGAELLLLPSWLLDCVTLGRLFHHFTLLSLVYYMRLAMHPAEDRLS